MSDVRKILADFDAGKLVRSMALGGLGPGHEQTIQLLSLELIRDNLDKPLPERAYMQWSQPTVARLRDSLELLEEPQIAAAVWFAWHALKNGWTSTVESAAREQQILISNHWPRVNR